MILITPPPWISFLSFLSTQIYLGNSNLTSNWFFDPRNRLLDPKNLGKEFKQHSNWAKFHLSCFQRFGNRFGGPEGVVRSLFASFCAPFQVCTILKLFENDPFLQPIGKNPRICSAGLETGCKAVLLLFILVTNPSLPFYFFPFEQFSVVLFFSFPFCLCKQLANTYTCSHM